MNGPSIHVHNFYANENIHPSLVVILRGLGHTVLTTHEVVPSNCGKPDKDQLAYACSVGLTVLTYDRDDYFHLHRDYQIAHDRHSGIIICQQDGDHARLANAIHADVSQRQDLTNTLIRINSIPTAKKRRIIKQKRRRR